MINVYMYNYKEVGKKLPLGIILGEQPNQKSFNNGYNLACSIEGINENIDNEIICETIFGYFNSDDRPNGKIQRSMSVGDIIQIKNKMYICYVVGFKEMENLDLSKINKDENYKIYNAKE